MKDILSIAALAAIVSAGAADSASAATNLVEDPFFANSANNSQGFQYGAAPPWYTVGYTGNLHAVYWDPNYVGWIQTNFTNGPPGITFSKSGDKAFYSDAQPNYQSMYLYQDISGLTPGKKYVLSFYDAYVNENYDYYTVSGNQAQWEVNIGGTDNESTNPLGHWVTGGTTFTTPLENIDPTAGAGWFYNSYTFTATAAMEQLSFKSLGSGFPPFAILTDVSITGGVPEPSTWAMTGIGFVGLGGLSILARRRRAATPAI